jgi:hypothetical protein
MTEAGSTLVAGLKIAGHALKLLSENLIVIAALAIIGLALLLLPVKYASWAGIETFRNDHRAILVIGTALLLTILVLNLLVALAKLFGKKAKAFHQSKLGEIDRHREEEEEREEIRAQADGLSPDERNLIMSHVAANQNVIEDSAYMDPRLLRRLATKGIIRHTNSSRTYLIDERIFDFLKEETSS